MNKAPKLLLLAIALFAQSRHTLAAEPAAKQAEDDGKAMPAPPQKPSIDADGTVHIPAFAVPLSSYMSEEAKKRFIEIAEEAKKRGIDQAQKPPAKGSSSPASPCPGRERLDNWHRSFIERATAVYPVNIEEQKIAGVRTDVVTPKGGVSARNRKRVLISLHGGGYSCATSGGLAGQVEAIPIAGVGKFKVIAIDFRSSPDYKFPAATEDVAAVYRELLKDYKPENIGIYGCSTGATLSAGAVAWFQKEKLPRPGAIGLFGDGATKDDHVDGDAWYMASALMGYKIPAPGQTFEVLHPEPYMSGTDYKDPLVAPVVSLEVLSKFPPTLLVAGTRDVGLSEVLYTHARLVKAGVETNLHVWDGMWHNFHFDVDLPESKEAFDVATKFFDRHLGEKAR